MGLGMRMGMVWKRVKIAGNTILSYLNDKNGLHLKDKNGLYLKTTDM